MLVKAIKKGYYGERVRNAGVTFNYKLKDQKAYDAGKEKLPSWMVEAGKSSANQTQSKEGLIESLSAKVDEAKANLKNLEAIASNADDDLSNAKTKTEKKEAQDAANMANENVDDAAIVLSEAEDALAEAES